jgi:hypothetical protein
LQSLRPVNLLISLTIFLPIVLVYSTYPPVSVLVRIPNILFAALFSDTWVNSVVRLLELLFMLHFKTKRRIFQPLLARHLKAEFRSAQNLPYTVMSQIKTNTRKDRNINRLPIHYAPINQGLMLGSPNPQSNNVAEESLDISTFRVLT